ncbi:MAG TPA: hypothetical protein VI980_08305 [Acidimicrobiia bacterium]|nr:hypothetical protein [Acidimicrobiia bacterium]
MLIVVLVAACAGSAATTTTELPAATSMTTAPTETTSTQAVITHTSPDSTTTVPSPDVTVAGGVVDGPDLFEYALGDQVKITVVTDVADEIHVHGYDLRYDAEPGVPVEISFEADAQGIFEVELETTRLPLFELRVTS